MMGYVRGGALCDGARTRKSVHNYTIKTFLCKSRSMQHDCAVCVGAHTQMHKPAHTQLRKLLGVVLFCWFRGRDVSSTTDNDDGESNRNAMI